MFNLEAEVKRASAAWLAANTLGIPTSIKKSPPADLREAPLDQEGNSAVGQPAERQDNAGGEKGAA